MKRPCYPFALQLIEQLLAPLPLVRRQKWTIIQQVCDDVYWTRRVPTILSI